MRLSNNLSNKTEGAGISKIAKGAISYAAILVIGAGVVGALDLNATKDINASALDPTTKIEKVIDHAQVNHAQVNHAQVNHAQVNHAQVNNQAQVEQSDVSAKVIHGTVADIGVSSIQVFQKEGSSQATIKVLPDIGPNAEITADSPSNVLMDYLGVKFDTINQMNRDAVEAHLQASTDAVSITRHSLETNGVTQTVNLDSQGNISAASMDKAVNNALERMSRTFDLSAQNATPILASSSHISHDKNLVAQIDGSDSAVYTAGVNIDHSQAQDLAMLKTISGMLKH